MSNKISPVTYCFAAYNEEEVIKETVEKIKLEFDKKFGPHNYEILIVENGSTDKTLQILKKIKHKNLRVIQAPRKGHGLALRIALGNAKYERIAINGADIPFGFSDINIALKYWDKYDMIFGSKLHPKSDFPTNPSRKFSSRIYSALLDMFFHIGINDVQGSLFLKKSLVVPILPYCTADNAFFTTQLAIYSKAFGYTMYEIPVKRKVSLKKERKSKYNIFRDGSKMFIEILKEYYKYNKMSPNLKKGVL